MNFPSTTPCWFNLREKQSSNNGLNSQKWTLAGTKRQTDPITTGASVPSATAPTSASSPSSTSPESVTASATGTASASSSKGDITAGAKVGLGIGVGFATLLVCGGLFWLYYRHVKRQEHHEEVYRRIVGGQGVSGGGGGVPPGPGQDAIATPNDGYLEPWRYGGTPQPVPSAVGSAWSGVSDQSSADWYAGQNAGAGAPYQYYDPVGAQTGAAGGGGAGAAYLHHQPPPQSSSILVTTASMAAEPPRSVIVRNQATTTTEHVPEAAAIRDVRDLSSSLYPSEYNEQPVSPVSAAAAEDNNGASIPPTRVASVNYGPNGPRDASTGADFTLLPDYMSPVGIGDRGGGVHQRGDHHDDDDDDLYGPPTPRSPPPPHSAHAHIADGQHQYLPTQQQQQRRHEMAQEQGQEQHPWQYDVPLSTGTQAIVVELPTAQTHRGGYGPQVELPADNEVGMAVAHTQQRQLRQQRSDLRGPEQKVLLRDVAPLRHGEHQQHHRNEG
jgi:hypothetical protein